MLVTYILELLLLLVPIALSSGVSLSTTQGRKTCTVTPLGNEQDDVPNILEAFAECGSDALVVFPEGQNYTIGTRLNPYAPKM